MTPIRVALWLVVVWLALAIVAWIVASGRALAQMRRMRRLHREQLQRVNDALPSWWDTVPSERARMLRDSGTRPGR